jgi:hypothetical protein
LFSRHALLPLQPLVKRCSPVSATASTGAQFSTVRKRTALDSGWRAANSAQAASPVLKDEPPP